MADMEARREARRQKILQSSQDRMNRVLGTIQHEAPDTESRSSIAFDSRGNIFRRDAPDIAKSSETKKDTLSDDIKQRQNVPVSENNSAIKEREVTNRQTVRNTVKISPLKKKPLSQKSETSDESLNISRSSSEAKMMLKHFEFLRIVLCFMVGFLCRKVLTSGYGIFYVQTIVLPFVCLEAGFFLFKQRLLHNIVLPHRSSLIMGLLMLCGIKPEVLMMYNKIMGYVTAASEDFAMFLFAFLMSHIFV